MSIIKYSHSFNCCWLSYVSESYGVILTKVTTKGSKTVRSSDENISIVNDTF